MYRGRNDAWDGFLLSKTRKGDSINGEKVLLVEAEG